MLRTNVKGYRVRLLGIVLFAGAAAFASPVLALELFGFTLFGGAEEREPVPGEMGYTLTFDLDGADSDLQDALRGASQLVTDKDDPILNSAGLLSRANGDYRRFLAELYANGYYAGSISIAINGREAAGIPLTSTLPENSEVQISILPGPAFVFGETNIDPVAKGTVLPDQFTTGAPAYSDTILQAEDAVIAAWRSRGHALADVAQQDVAADHRAQTLDIRIGIAPGPVLSYGPVSVTGTKRMDADFVRYMTGLTSGDQFDPDELERARERLIGLGVFRAVTIAEGQDVLPGDQIDIGFDVIEMPRRRYGIGATVSNVDGVGFSAYWLHRNLFRRAETLRVDFTVDRIGIENSFETYNYALGASFIKPGVFTPDTSFNLSSSVDQVVFEDIRSRQFDLYGGLEHTFGNLQISGGLFAAYKDVEDDFGLRLFRMAGARVGVEWDNRDNPLNPGKGFYAAFDLTPFREFAYGNTGIHYVSEFRGYQLLDAAGKFRLAERVRFGGLTGLDVDQAPTDMVFFAGGTETVRGYDFQSIGIDYGGNYGGGLSFVALGAELRAEITDSLGIVGFFDAASVSAGTVPTGGDDWFRGVGVGLRYNTSFGPLRLDIARGLDLRPGDPDYAIYVGLGQAF